MAASAVTRDTTTRSYKTDCIGALTRLNPGLPAGAVFDAYRKLLRVEAPNLLGRNRALHRMLVDGVNVEYTRSDGSIAGAQAKVIDFERPEHNDWLAVNQFTVVERPRRHCDLCQRAAAWRRRAEEPG
jgi:type I site-specific restriction-modification system R (restriction) subunit